MFLEFYATVPALDTFVTMEKSQRIRNFLEVRNDYMLLERAVFVLRNFKDNSLINYLFNFYRVW